MSARQRAQQFMTGRALLGLIGPTNYQEDIGVLENHFLLHRIDVVGECVASVRKDVRALEVLTVAQPDIEEAWGETRRLNNKARELSAVADKLERTMKEEA